MAAEQENVRAVLCWAVEQGEVELGLRLAGALWRFWDIHGHLSEGHHWLEALLARGGTVAAAVRAKALRCAGLLAAKQGDYERALSLSGASLAHYQELGDKAGIARVLNDMGEAARKQGDYEQALPLYEKSLALQRELGHKAGVAAVLNNPGTVASAQGDYQKAISLSYIIEESLALEREPGNKEGIVVSLTNLGGVALEQGDIARALTLY